MYGVMAVRFDGCVQMVYWTNTPQDAIGKADLMRGTNDHWSDHWPVEEIALGHYERIDKCRD